DLLKVTEWSIRYPHVHRVISLLCYAASFTHLVHLIWQQRRRCSNLIYWLGFAQPFYILYIYTCAPTNLSL
ncbi:hypothetical protein B0J11DRAFT_280787, partial [Dendryphion nanum]